MFPLPLHPLRVGLLEVQAKRVQEEVYLLLYCMVLDCCG